MIESFEQSPKAGAQSGFSRAAQSQGSQARDNSIWRDDALASSPAGTLPTFSPTRDVAFA